MKATLARTALAPLALAIFAMPANAQVRPSGPEIEGAVRFGLPALFNGFRATCSAQLAPDGYVALNADRLLAKFAEGADAHWPAAKAALSTLGDDQGMDSAMLAEMPDDALKPFVTALLQQMVVAEIKPTQCVDVERGLELVDPLPADNIASLIGFMVEMAERDESNTNAAGVAGE
jgi:hypothetical protein